jgi:hypothetical protein
MFRCFIPQTKPSKEYAHEAFKIKLKNIYFYLVSFFITAMAKVMQFHCKCILFDKMIKQIKGAIGSPMHIGSNGKPYSAAYCIYIYNSCYCTKIILNYCQ